MAAAREEVPKLADQDKDQDRGRKQGRDHRDRSGVMEAGGNMTAQRGVAIANSHGWAQPGRRRRPIRRLHFRRFVTFCLLPRLVVTTSLTLSRLLNQKCREALTIPKAGFAAAAQLSGHHNMSVHLCTELEGSREKKRSAAPVKLGFKRLERRPVRRDGAQRGDRAIAETLLRLSFSRRYTLSASDGAEPPPKDAAHHSAHSPTFSSCFALYALSPVVARRSAHRSSPPYCGHPGLRHRQRAGESPHACRRPAADKSAAVGLPFL